MVTTLTDFDWFRDIIKDIDHYRTLNDWESQFIASIEEKVKNKIPLSEKQCDKLISIWEQQYK